MFTELKENEFLNGLRLEVVNIYRKRLYDNNNKKSLERLAVIDEMVNNGAYAGGLFGAIMELVNATKFSRKMALSTQHRPDIFIKYRATESSEIDYIPCECKTGNGELNELYKAGASRFVIYCYILDNKNGKRWLEPQVMPRAVFLEMLEKNGLIDHAPADKLHGERLRVKGQSAKLYKWLENYGLPFDPDAIYTASDFEEIDTTI